MQIELTVHGLPAPQGSKKFVGVSKKTGHGILIESSKAVGPWREAVKTAFIRQFAGVLRPVVSGAVDLGIIFYLPKPGSVKRTFPCVKPDLSKLIRSTEDALTDVGAWEDDSRVIQTHCYKHYCSEEGMSSPGAKITIRRID